MRGRPSRPWNESEGDDLGDGEVRAAFLTALYTKNMRYLKKTEDRVAAVKMIFMRARDIEREGQKASQGQYTFTITAYNLGQQKWDRCPGCGDPDINKESASGKSWQGCFNCHILLGSKGIIKSMDPHRGAK
jgi:hypothetical protein